MINVYSEAERALDPRPSATLPDWSRELCEPLEWSPGRQLLASLREYQRACAESSSLRAGCLARAKLAVLRHRFWSAVTGADIPLNACSLGGGLILPHPVGVVIHPEAVLGPNCIVFQQVTIGTGNKPGLPSIGGAVDIGPGARILGGIRIGDGATVGANAVVTTDVPAGGSVVAPRGLVRDPAPLLSSNFEP